MVIYRLTREAERTLIQWKGVGTRPTVNIIAAGWGVQPRSEFIQIIVVMAVYGSRLRTRKQAGQGNVSEDKPRSIERWVRGSKALTVCETGLFSRKNNLTCEWWITPHTHTPAERCPVTLWGSSSCQGRNQVIWLDGASSDMVQCVHVRKQNWHNILKAATCGSLQLNKVKTDQRQI